MDLNSITIDTTKADELENYFKTRKKVKISARDLHAPPNRKRW